MNKVEKTQDTRDDLQQAYSQHHPKQDKLKTFLLKSETR